MTPTGARILVLEAGRADREYWHQVWLRRDLLVMLAWRDISARYKQTAIGAAWAVLRPFLTMVVFTIVFGHLANMRSASGVPYPIVVFAGILPWYLFSGILSDAANSLTANAGLIGKVYFPRIILPAAAAAVSLVDFAVSFIVMIGVMIWYGFVPGIELLFLPVMVVFAVMTSLGPGLLLSALNVKYRDFRYIVPFALQIGLYISPVGFSSSVIPERWIFLYHLNPLVGVIAGFRWCLTGDLAQLYVPGFLLSLVATAFFLGFGLIYFRGAERQFADVI